MSGTGRGRWLGHPSRCGALSCGPAQGARSQRWLPDLARNVLKRLKEVLRLK